MWSFGCILYELLKYTIRDSSLPIDEFKKDRYLFQGTSCYPLTPAKKKEGEANNLIGY